MVAFMIRNIYILIPVLVAIYILRLSKYINNSEQKIFRGAPRINVNNDYVCYPCGMVGKRYTCRCHTLSDSLHPLPEKALFYEE